MKVNLKNMLKLKREKGYALLVVLLILGLLSVIVLGVNIIIATKLKVTIATAHSVVAFYAAESGSEKILYDDRKGAYDPNPAGIGFVITPPGKITLSNGATYEVILLNDSPTSIKSIGSFQNVKRALELNYSN